MGFVRSSNWREKDRTRTGKGGVKSGKIICFFIDVEKKTGVFTATEAVVSAVDRRCWLTLTLMA